VGARKPDGGPASIASRRLSGATDSQVDWLWNRAHHVGTGNHFIEICLDEADAVWVMLHSGSRGVGGRIGSYFIELAKEDRRTWFVNLPDKDLAYLPEGTEHFDDYVQAVS
jgi:tRNA-splicing ligase RtcB (3'-phosphate/5'-hydroxy nucleic acid ligase)